MTADALIQAIHGTSHIRHIPQQALDDAKQSAILDVLTHPSTYETVNFDRAFIDKMIRNHYADLVKAERRAQYLDQDTTNQLPKTTDAYQPQHPDVYNHLRDLRDQMVRTALLEIPERYRELLMYVADGGSISAYAKTHDLLYNAARQLYSRARKALSQALPPHLPQSMLRLGEYDKMLPDLSHWLSIHPDWRDTPCTETPEDAAASTGAPDLPSVPPVSPDVLAESTDHSWPCQDKSS